MNTKESNKSEGNEFHLDISCWCEPNSDIVTIPLNLRDSLKYGLKLNNNNKPATKSTYLV